jgi:hypothetical protein
VHVCIDDHSRIAFADIMHDQKKRAAIAFLKAAVAYYASLGVKVERVMTDNGSCYRSLAFRGACQRLGLKHIRTTALHAHDAAVDCRPPVSPVPVIRENVVSCLHDRVAREAALRVVSLRRTGRLSGGAKRIGRRVILERAPPPSAAVREPLAVLHHEIDVMLGTWHRWWTRIRILFFRDPMDFRHLGAVWKGLTVVGSQVVLSLSNRPEHALADQCSLQRLLALFVARRLIQDSQHAAHQQAWGITVSPFNTSTICATLAESIVRLLSRSCLQGMGFVMLLSSSFLVVDISPGRQFEGA